MKTIWLVPVLLLWAMVAFAQPRLELLESEYDFGEVKQGDILEHTFTIINTGNETLIIKKITSS